MIGTVCIITRSNPRQKTAPHSRLSIIPRVMVVVVNPRLGVWSGTVTMDRSGLIIRRAFFVGKEIYRSSPRVKSLSHLPHTTGGKTTSLFVYQWVSHTFSFFNGVVGLLPLKGNFLPPLPRATPCELLGSVMRHPVDHRGIMIELKKRTRTHKHTNKMREVLRWRMRGVLGWRHRKEKRRHETERRRRYWGRKTVLLLWWVYSGIYNNCIGNSVKQDVFTKNVNCLLRSFKLWMGHGICICVGLFAPVLPFCGRQWNTTDTILGM